MHWQASTFFCRIRRPGVALLAALSLSSNIVFAQHNKATQNNIAIASPSLPTLHKLTPIADKPTPAEPAKPVHAASPVKEPLQDQYPTLGRMENITFGHANSGLPLETRLNYLEATIFRQSFDKLSPNQRAAKLQETLFGAVEDTHFPGAAPAAKVEHHPQQSNETLMEPSASSGSFPSPAPPARRAESNAVRTERAAEQAQENINSATENQPFYQAQISYDELKIFVLQMINDRRQLQGLPPLAVDEVAAEVAQTHAVELAKRNSISHFDAAGENPDQRYTKAGGSDSITECLDMISDHGKINRLAGMMFLRNLLNKQDDRDALMSPDATGFGFAAAENQSRNRAYACFELVCKHGLMQPVPQEVKVGEKIEVKGGVFEPYRIDRVTLAWEHPNAEGLAGADESEEALPYFPPLDFVAYAAKSEHDWSTGVQVLKAAGIVACIAGGMFIPPVALGVPAISMMGTPDQEPKAYSDIPVKGGVKLSGPLFNVKVAISNNNKPGLYYLTVWAMPPGGSKSVPISRRIIVATDDSSHHKQDKHAESNSIDNEIPNEK